MDYVILVLAVWRMSSLVANEAGPYELFERLRTKAGVRYDEYSNPYGTNEVAKALLCIWCVSFWIGAAWALGYWLTGAIAIWAALPFALSAGAVLVDEFVANGE